MSLCGAGWANHEGHLGRQCKKAARTAGGIPSPLPALDKLPQRATGLHQLRPQEHPLPRAILRAAARTHDEHARGSCVLDNRERCWLPYLLATATQLSCEDWEVVWPITGVEYGESNHREMISHRRKLFFVNPGHGLWGVAEGTTPERAERDLPGFDHSVRYVDVVENRKESE
jgi:hypothetical protein